MMVGLDQAGFSDAFDNDLEIVEAMVTQQSVFCLPGKCFNIPNFFRIVLTVPQDLMGEACDRIGQFCQQHYDPRLRNRPLLQLASATNQEETSSGFSNGSSSDEMEEEENIRLSKIPATFSRVASQKKMSVHSRVA